MTDDKKRELAERLVDLSVMGRAKCVASDNCGPNKDLMNKMRSRMRQQQISLYCKHFQTEQLQALVDFYSTEMGKSILRSQERISDELSFGLAGTRFRAEDT